ncbi:MAG: homocysteine S-methyltransferase family protein [Desulfovibrionaceae bacterium]
MLDLKKMLQSGRILLLDGAMGTMLQGAGMPAGAEPTRFCVERPDILQNIHAAYVQAGADILTTCTFGGSSYKLSPDMDVIDFNRAMAQAARHAAQSAGGGRQVFVAGNVGPTGHFACPLGDVEPSDLITAFRQQIRGLVQGGVDCIFIETQFDLAEARAAVIAARTECALPIIVSMTFEKNMSLTGSSPELFAETMQNLGVTALGTNCSAGPEQMIPVVEELLAYSRVPVLVEPNAGLPELINGKTVFRLAPEEFAQKTAAFAAAGAQILGGCCGTSPAHIAALRQAVGGMTHRKPECRVGLGSIALTSRSSIVRIGEGQPISIIGERINPTGKKQLTAELQAGEYGLALRYADEQLAAGSPILDVNVGAPLVDESVCLPQLVQRLVGRVSAPLSLDSSHMGAIEQALPYCPGSALVNSISGETGRMEFLGPLCRDYGSPFILLPLRGKKLPVMAAERIAILEELIEQADALAIPRRLLLVDVLALAVSSKGEAGVQCLETIRWCCREGLPTTIGLSNVSFGLPARDLLNATCLSMAVGAGLTACIGNPSNLRLREVLDTAEVLLGRDRNAEQFIASYAHWTAGADSVVTSQTAKLAAATTLEDAVLRGNKESVTALVEAELAQGADPLALVQEKLIPAITEVGARYERREYFLPQLIRAAETMQKAFKTLKPLLEAQRGPEQRPVIVLATVEGDIHDIGKNIVALLLGNHGFDVIDAGKDVKAVDIIACAKKHKAAIVGLSALMTTTMVRMEDTVKLVRAEHLPYKVIIGGAVVTQAFADAIGADGYSADAVSAVRVAKSLLPTN